MEIRDSNNSSVSQTLKVDQIIGTKIIAKNGSEMGKLKAVHINPKTFEVTGITVNPGFFSKEYYVAKGFVKSINEYEVVFNINPFQDLLKRIILTRSGTIFGEVENVFSDKNKICFDVKRKKGKNVVISEEDIDFIKDDIILKKDAAN